MATKVGFIGLGYMGKGMAKCIVRAGFNTLVYDIVKEPVEELVKAGARATRSLSELAAASEVVIVIVRNDAQVEEVVLSKAGVLPAIKPGSTILIMSTVSPLLVRRIAQEAKGKGVGVLDAPVSGQKREEGMLTIMVGGEEKLFQQCLPVLQAMGKNIFHLGDVGAGEVAKLVNNAASIGVLFATTEALTLGVKAGVKLEKLLAVLQAKESAGNSFIANNWDIISWMKREYQRTGGGPSELIFKDMGLFLSIARELRLDLPVCSLVSNLNPGKLPE